MVRETDNGSPATGPVPKAQELLGRMEDAALINLVLEAVHEFDLAPSRERATSFNPAQTTTLLVYCYARGIFSSEEIETRLPLDPAVSYICAGAKPDWVMLRRFRRENGLLLIGVLTRLLELVSRQLEPARPSTIPERWRTGFREQALDRLREAIQADTMAMDH